MANAPLQIQTLLTTRSNSHRPLVLIFLSPLKNPLWHLSRAHRAGQILNYGELVPEDHAIL